MSREGACACGAGEDMENDNDDDGGDVVGMVCWDASGGGADGPVLEEEEVDDGDRTPPGAVAVARDGPVCVGVGAGVERESSQEANSTVFGATAATAEAAEAPALALVVELGVGGAGVGVEAAGAGVGVGGGGAGAGACEAALSAPSGAAVETGARFVICSSRRRISSIFFMMTSARCATI